MNEECTKEGFLLSSYNIEVRAVGREVGREVGTKEREPGLVE